MNRRNFVRYGLTSAGVLSPAWTFAAACPPSPISVANGTSITTGCAGGSGQSDWVARSTAAGVVQAIRFTTAASVTNYTHSGAPFGNVVLDATDGILGDGCLRINVPPGDGANSGAWRAPLNAAWNSDGQGFGASDFYVQYRFKLGPSRLTPSNNGGGFKVALLGGYKFSSPSSSASHTGHEIVVNNVYWRGSLFVYREHPVSGSVGFDVTDSVGIHLQPAVDHGASVADPNARYCLYQSGQGSSGCWFYREQEWVTLLMHVKVVDYGGAGVGNRFDLYAARAGETTYTQLFNNRDFRIGSDAGYPNGPNGLWLLPYDTDRTSANYSTWQKYDQVIVSTQPIACPVA